MKKILFVRKSNLQTGGVEMQMLRVALWLRTATLADSILATDDLNGKLATLFRNHGFAVVVCPLQGNFYFYKAVNSLNSLIRNFGITHLQSHMFRESIVCRVARTINPKVKHIFRIETYIDCSPISSVKKTLYHLLARFTGSGVDYYLPNGNMVEKELRDRSKIKSENVKVVFNGVESFGSPDMLPVAVNQDGFVEAVMVANLIRGKGHELLFEAVARLKVSGCNLKVFLYGDDMESPVDGIVRYSDELRALVHQLGISDRIVFCGFSNNLRSDLQKFQVLLLPSHSEGTPNTVLEALSTRKLVIVSDAGELSYMVENMNSGLVHKIDDLDGLVLSLQFIFGDHQSQIEMMRQNGYVRWQNLFSVDRMMEHMRDCYQ